MGGGGSVVTPPGWVVISPWSESAATRMMGSASRAPATTWVSRAARPRVRLRVRVRVRLRLRVRVRVKG